MKTKVGIIGATGYTGLELLRFLIHHPEIEITALTSQKYAGVEIGQVFPSLMNYLQIKCEELSVERISDKTDLVFTAVPHKTAMETVPLFFRKEKKVVDLSADFRFKDAGGCVVAESKAFFAGSKKGWRQPFFFCRLNAHSCLLAAFDGN